jgi:N-carbamoyl-L-amino-acid hydrolase
LEPAAYLELHIEQGPVLEAREIPVGIVTSVQGMRQYKVTVKGESGHAGTVPNTMRKDAALAAAQIISSIHARSEGPDDQLRLTVGRIETCPGVINTIANKAVFTIDLRHPQDERLEEVEAIILEESRRIGGPDAHITPLLEANAVAFDAGLIALAESAAQALEIPTMRIPSGATHDARHLASVCPAAMLFVPCRAGISHNEREWAEAGHLGAGTRVLAEVVASYCFTPLAEVTQREHIHDAGV